MLLFVYYCLCAAFLSAPVVALDSASNSCGENGDCSENRRSMINQMQQNHANGFQHNKDNNSIPIQYDIAMIDEFGNGVGNVSSAGIKRLLQTLTEKHNTQDKIQKEVAFVFQGVIVAVILFGVCACICVVTACIYCCRINITDNRLKNDVEALAEKLKRECRFKKSAKPLLQPISESCNIIVEDAGVFVV